MKKRGIFNCLVLCLLSSLSWGQVSKGTKYWGAGITISGNANRIKSNDEFKGNQINLNPQLQYGGFYKDNRMFGVLIGANISRYVGKNVDLDGKDTFNQTDLRIAPFLRQYKPLGDKWLIFLQESASFTYSFYNFTSNNGKSKETGYGVGLNVVPGVSYRVSRRFLLESDINLVSLGVNYSKIDDLKSFSFQSSVTTGIQSYFGLRAAWFLNGEGK